MNKAELKKTLTEFFANPDEWRRNHKLCPVCRKEDYCITTGGLPLNAVDCSCGWKGAECQLTPRRGEVA